MEGEIPITVTKKKQKKSDLIFKVATPQFIQQLKLARNPTVPKARPGNRQQRHKTLDPDGQVSRTRRISSSAAAKRFPKDFFKDQNCLNPNKSNRPRHKQYDPTFIDTFSHKNFIAMQVQIDDIATENNNQEDTPKFKQKKGQQMSTKDRLLEYIGYKKGQNYTPTRQKYSTCPEKQSKAPLGLLNQVHEAQMRQKKVQIGAIPIISNFNITLGQKETLTTLLQKGQKFKRKQECSQKENNNYLSPPVMEAPKRQSVQKAQGFRIRKKVLGLLG